MHAFLTTYKRLWIPSLSLLCFLLVWQLSVSFGLIPNFLLPTPLQVFEALIQDKALILNHSIATLAEAALGLLAGLVLGFICALLMDRFSSVAYALDPLLTLSQTIPTIAIAPILVLWFGYGLLPKIILVMLTTFFPVAVSLITAFRSVDPELIDLMHIMGASRRQILFHVKLPAAAPELFGGLKIAATYAIVAAVIAEWLGGFTGLGVYMTRVRKSFAYDRLFASIVVVSGLSLLLMACIDYLKKICIPWSKEKEN